MNKKIYFVRNGECECNTKPIRQTVESPLTEKGREQASQVSNRLSKLGFDTLVSSTYPRAMQTAGEIGNCISGMMVKNFNIIN